MNNKQTVSADALKYLREEQARSFADSATQSEWTAQKWIWVVDDKEGFVAANIVKDNGDTYEVKLPSGLTKEFNKNDTFKMNPPKFDKAEDMAELSHLNEPAVLDNLRKRYFSNLIYVCVYAF
jgi:myosin protein heavy chain